jgi:transposase-like protein
MVRPEREGLIMRARRRFSAAFKRQVVEVNLTQYRNFEDAAASTGNG